MATAPTSQSVVLDTHAWLWWTVDESRLSVAAAGAIEAAESICISAISCWEMAMLVVKGRIELDRAPQQWIRQALAQPRVRAVSLDASMAISAALLEPLPGDPADRMIYATARSLGAPLVTRDAELHQFDPRATVW